MSLLHGALVSSGMLGDRIFDLADPGNRDDAYLPYVKLRDAFLARGVELHTPDVLQAREVVADFELHLNARRALRHPASYVLLLETPHIKPINGDRAHLERYRKVFTWREDWQDGQRFLPIAFPNTVVLPELDGLAARDRFACLIAGNKSIGRDDGRGLYGERVRTIRWFESHKPEDFDLFGPGWDRPASAKGMRGRALRWMTAVGNRVRGVPAFPSWRGLARSKREVMRRTRFAICYENVRDFPGYITEKIFDCFFAGCVPVYWGPLDIGNTIPMACFVDRRQFASHEALWSHLAGIGEEEYLRMQAAMREFLGSEAVRPFTDERFAVSVATAISEDLAIIRR